MLRPAQQIVELTSSTWRGVRMHRPCNHSHADSLPETRESPADGTESDHAQRLALKLYRPATRPTARHNAVVNLDHTAGDGERQHQGMFRDEAEDSRRVRHRDAVALRCSRSTLSMPMPIATTFGGTPAKALSGICRRANVDHDLGMRCSEQAMFRPSSVAKSGQRARHFRNDGLDPGTTG
jgi:hypothetical protein